MSTAIASLPRRRLLVAVTIALAAGDAAAATITVDSNDDSASSTSCNLRSAIMSIDNAAATANCAAAVSGNFGSDDTIVFAALADSTITLTQGQLPVTKSMTIVGSGQTVDAAGQSTAFYQVYAALSASDLTIQHGSGGSNAGGIEDIGGALVLDQVTLAYNQGGSAGAIFAFSGPHLATVAVTNSRLHGNNGNAGGAIAEQNSTLSVSETMLDGNGTMNGGGAINVNGGSVTVTDSVLVGNGALQGGAITTSGYVLLQRSIVAANTATNGAGVYLGGTSGNVVFVESTISGNTASGKGGAIGMLFGGTITLTNSTLAANTAAGNGGAIYGTKYPKVTLTNATISGNTAANGGAMYFKKDGGYGTTVLSFANSIVSANNAPTGPDLGGYFLELTGNNNLFGAALNTPPFNAVANNNVFSDSPGLGPLQNNGGFTDTMALLAGSPAIDAGSNASASGLTTDQRGTGFVRVANGTVDIGAYEYLGDRIFLGDFESAP